MLSFFSAASLAVFAVCAVSAVSEAGLGAYYPIRLMLGSFFGGADSVEVTDNAGHAAGYGSGQSETSPSDTPAQPSDKAMPGKADAAPDKTAAPVTGETAPLRMTLSSDDALVNETPYEPDISSPELNVRVIPALSEIGETYGSDAPVVLIVHTHATEAYAESASNDYRSSDTAANVVSCGDVIASVLGERGIPTIHSRELYDEKDFTMAYYSASLAIKRITEENPSVSYIIDVHRDSVVSDGEYIAPSVMTDDGYAAQMMFVVGTDHGGSGHSTWRNNLTLALRLQNRLNSDTPSLMRSINLRSASFNEQYTDGSLILEIGACGTPLEEAHRSAAVFAEALADEIIGN